MVEDLIKNLNKSMKMGEIQFGVEQKEVDRIPFSSCRMNYMTYGGIPVGRITEFSGADGSGKTTTALDLVGQCQKKFKDKKVLFVDIEHTFDPKWAATLGVDVDKILYYDPDSSSAEEVFDIVLDALDSGEISLCVLDSIGAMVSNMANESSIGQKQYGGISMALTKFAQKITPVLSRTNCTFVGINQIRDDLNSPWGGTKTVGGRNWQHSCSIRMNFRKGSYIDQKGNTLTRGCENPAGNLVEARLEKSKVFRLDRKIGFYTLDYLDGIDYVADAIDVAIKYNIISQAGAWFNLVDAKTGEVLKGKDGELLKFQGKPKLAEALTRNRRLFQTILKGIEKVEREQQ